MDKLLKKQVGRDVTAPQAVAPSPKNETGRIARFICAGSLAAATHLTSLWFITTYTGLWYIPASVIGFLLAFLVSFTLQKFWTFADLDRGFAYRQVANYLALQLAALTANTVGLYLLVEFVGIWYLAAQAFLLVLVAAATYLLSKHVIFNAGRKADLLSSHS